jgi:hypothetical protein
MLINRDSRPRPVRIACHDADHDNDYARIGPLRFVRSRSSFRLASLSKGGVKSPETRLASDFGEYGAIL